MPSVSLKVRKSLSVPLPSGWVIHHLNGDHSDDRVENLVALPKEIHDLIPTLKQEAHVWQYRLNRFEEALVELGKRQRDSKKPCRSTDPFLQLIRILDSLPKEKSLWLKSMNKLFPLNKTSMKKLFPLRKGRRT